MSQSGVEKKCVNFEAASVIVDMAGLVPDRFYLKGNAASRAASWKTERFHKPGSSPTSAGFEIPDGFD